METRSNYVAAALTAAATATAATVAADTFNIQRSVDLESDTDDEDEDIPPPLLIAGIKTQNIEGDTKMT